MAASQSASKGAVEWSVCSPPTREHQGRAGSYSLQLLHSTTTTNFTRVEANPENSYVIRDEWSLAAAVTDGISWMLVKVGLLSFRRRSIVPVGQLS